MCPIETPEGPNIGLIGSLASMATVSEFGFIQTPYRKVVKRQGDRRDHLSRRRRGGAVHDRAGLGAGRREDRQVRARPGALPLARGRGRDGARRRTSSYMDVSPAQIVSVATAMIPFLEHNDANRALMGANMQRQAVPLMIPQAPLVGTGLEYRAAVDSGDVVVAKQRRHGRRRRRRDDRRRGARAARDEYDLTKFMRSNQGTLIHHKPIVAPGRQGAGGPGARRRLLDRPRRARARREPARRVHAVRGLQLRGRDRALRAAREGGGAHLDPHPRVRDRRPLDEARRRGDHARHPEPLGGVARATSTSAASSASAPRSAPATCSSARSRRRARPS